MISGYNISQHGYTGGYVGAASWYAGERRLDNAKLWIDEDAANGVVDDPADLVDQVFSDDFGSTDDEITPTHDANGNLTFDGVYKYTYDAWNP